MRMMASSLDELHGGAIIVVVTDIKLWAEAQFGECELGDARRTKRAVKVAMRAAEDPDGATPEQMGDWAGCKAAYRLFSSEDVSFDALCTPHWTSVRGAPEGTVRLLNDTTSFSFSLKREISGLGPVGDGISQGFHLHSSLMVAPDTDEVLGIAGAEIFDRKSKPRGETASQQKTRKRESEVWGRVIDGVGRPPEGSRFIHVCDAGADNFEVFCHLRQQDCGWVVRLCQKKRCYISESGDKESLDELISKRPVAGTYQLHVSANRKQAARKANLEVRFAQMSMPRPTQLTPFIRDSGIVEIGMTVVEVREVNPPQGVQPLRWLLSTSEQVSTFEDAWKVIEWYEKRPLIEDYHKCIKTGCRVEDRQYRDAEKLKRMLGVMCIVAVRLLQLKFVSRSKKDVPAKDVVPTKWITTLKTLRPRDRVETVRDFFRTLAKFGGFLGRKSDGEPGWITIWRGLRKLIPCVQVAEAMSKKCG